MNDLESFPYETVVNAHADGMFWEIMSGPVGWIGGGFFVAFVVACFFSPRASNARKGMVFGASLTVGITVFVIAMHLILAPRAAALTALQEWVEEKYGLGFTLEQVDAMAPFLVSRAAAGYEGAPLTVDGASYLLVNSGDGLLLKKSEVVDSRGILEQLPGGKTPASR